MGLPKRLAVKAGLFVLSLFAVLVAEFLFFQIDQVDLSCPSNLGYNVCWFRQYLLPVTGAGFTIRVNHIVASSYGYGQPVWTRFLDYLRLMLTGNFGINVSNVTSGWVASTISQRLPFTALLASSVVAVVVVVSRALGLSAPAGRAKRLSLLPAVAFALVGVGLPFIFLFSLWNTIHPPGLTQFAPLLGHLVPSGYVTVAVSAYMLSGPAYYGAILWSMLVPFLEVAAIVFLTLLLVRFLFGGPVSFMTAFVMVLISSIFWTMLLETVFGWPGLGQALYFSWVGPDYPLEQAVVFEMLAIPLAVVFALWCTNDILSALRAPPVTMGQGSGAAPPEQPPSSAPSTEV